MNKSQRTKHTVGIMAAILLSQQPARTEIVVKNAMKLYEEVSHAIDETTTDPADLS